MLQEQRTGGLGFYIRSSSYGGKGGGGTGTFTRFVPIQRLSYIMIGCSRANLCAAISQTAPGEARKGQGGVGRGRGGRGGREAREGAGRRGKGQGGAVRLPGQTLPECVWIDGWMERLPNG